MTHSQLPLETKWKYLLNLAPKSLLNACKVSKENDETCKDQDFWASYFSGMSTRRTNEVLQLISNNSQGYVIGSYEGALRQKPIEVSPTTTTILLFNSVMRDDKKAIEYFGNTRIEVNAEKIRKIVAKVINIINNEQYDDEKVLEEGFKDYYDAIKLFRSDIHVDISPILLKKLKLGAINNIYIASINSNKYNVFVTDIIITLARRGDVALIVSIMNRVKDRINEHNQWFNQYIADYLSIDLFDYVDKKLGIKLIQYIYDPQSEEKIEYWISHSTYKNLKQIMRNYKNAFYFVNPKTYAEIIYTTDVSQLRKDRNIQLTADNARHKKFIRWANELESIWIELNNEENDDDN